MRAALWLIILFALAVAGAWLAGNNQGSVTLFLFPHRIDLSLNLAVLAVFLVEVVLDLSRALLEGGVHRFGMVCFFQDDILSILSILTLLTIITILTILTFKNI